MTHQLTSLRMKTSKDDHLRFIAAIVFITILYVAIYNSSKYNYEKMYLFMILYMWLNELRIILE